MTAWSRRPPETAALFNPALLALMCAGLAEGWFSVAGSALPLPLAPPGCALLLSAHAHEALPATRRTRLGPWVEAHGRERHEAAELARALAPRVAEGLRLGVRRGVLEARPPGVTGRGPRRGLEDLSIETRALLKRAPWVGSWLAHGGDPATVLALLGRTP